MSRIEQALEKAARQRECKPEIIPASLMEAGVFPSADVGVAPVLEMGGGRKERDAALLLENPLTVSSPFLVAPGTRFSAAEVPEAEVHGLRLTKRNAFNTLLVAVPAAMRKTLTALNLAIVRPDYEHSVDGRRRPAPARSVTGIQPEAGLAQSSGQRPISRFWLRLARPSWSACRKARGRPVELLASARMKEIVGN
jgi:hypothetical protein